MTERKPEYAKNTPKDVGKSMYTQRTCVQVKEESTFLINLRGRVKLRMSRTEASEGMKVDRNQSMNGFTGHGEELEF